MNAGKQCPPYTVRKLQTLTHRGCDMYNTGASSSKTIPRMGMGERKVPPQVKQLLEAESC